MKTRHLLFLACLVGSMFIPQDAASRKRIAELEAEVAALKAELARCVALAKHDPFPADGNAVMVLEVIVPEETKVILGRVRNEINELERRIATKQGKNDRESQAQVREWTRELTTQKRRRESIEAHPRWWILGWDGVRDVHLFVEDMKVEQARELVYGNAIMYTGEEIDTYMGHESSKDYTTIVCHEWRVTTLPQGWTARTRAAVWKRQFTSGPKVPPTPVGKAR